MTTTTGPDLESDSTMTATDEKWRQVVALLDELSEEIRRLREDIRREGFVAHS